MDIKKLALLMLAAFFFSLFVPSANALIKIVAAENIYGEVAKELGGPYVSVISILNSPTQDPHLFTTTPSTAIAVSEADIVIYNGADYDPWMKSILSIKGQKLRQVIDVALLARIKPGDNPHIWYMPTAMPLFAKALIELLIQDDPKHQLYFENRLNQFNMQYQIIFKTIETLKQRFKDTPIIATEPLFGYMANSIGLKMHGDGFQINVMNGVPPDVSQIKSFENDLRKHSVRLLIYNSQVINPLTEGMRLLAEKERIPILGVSEMLPPGMTYIQWMENELAKLEKALENSREK